MSKRKISIPEKGITRGNSTGGSDDEDVCELLHDIEEPLVDEAAAEGVFICLFVHSIPYHGRGKDL